MRGPLPPCLARHTPLLCASIALALAGLAHAQPASPAPVRAVSTGGDVLAHLGENIVLVIGLDHDPRILVVDEDGEFVGPHWLGIGDDYRGWRIEGVTETEVTLSRASRRRAVQLVGKSGAAEQGQGRRPGQRASVSLSNAVVGGSPPPADAGAPASPDY